MGTSPEKGASAPADAPVPAPVAFGADAVIEKVTKAPRVFRDVPGTRVQLPDGRAAALQREARADGTPGPVMCAVIRVSETGESGQRYPLRDLQLFSDALQSATGRALLAPPAPAPEK